MTYLIKQIFSPTLCKMVLLNLIPVTKSNIYFHLESHRHALAADSSWILLILSYLSPVYDIPFDMYKWNFDLVAHAMKFTLTILVDGRSLSIHLSFY